MKQSINLLPLEYHRRTLVRRYLVQWSLIWAGCVALAAGICWTARSRLDAARDTVQTARHNYAPLARLIGQRNKLQAELHRLEAKGTVYGQLRDRRPMLTLIGLASRSAQQCNGRLVVHELVFDRHQEQASGGGRKPPAPNKPSAATPKAGEPWGTVTFSGEALDNLAVATFAAALRDCGLFRHVELKSSIDSRSDDSPLRSYSLKCDI